jgi:hypothetical protein
MGRFWSICWGTLVRPGRAIDAIRTTATVGDGVTIASIFGLLYSLAALTAYRTGRVPRSRSVTAIPASEYYRWESLFTLPVTLLWITLLAASTRQVSKRLGGTGTVRSDFTVLAFTQSMPLIALLWLPDMVCYLLRLDSRRYARLVPLYGTAAVTWSVALSASGISATERMPWWRSLAAVVASEVVSVVGSGTALFIR